MVNIDNISSHQSCLIQDMKRLRWQCRRGVKELDVVLCAFLDKSYSSASVQDQHLFIELLALEDDQLLSYFFADSPVASLVNEKPETNELKQFIEKIRTTFMG